MWETASLRCPASRLPPECVWELPFAYSSDFWFLRHSAVISLSRPAGCPGPPYAGPGPFGKLRDARTC
jgi:hypothetical protein